MKFKIRHINKYIKNINKYIKNINEYIRDISHKLSEDLLSEYAAECAFFTILSIFPFLMFFFSLIQYTNIEKEIIYETIRQLIPNSSYGFIIQIIDEIHLKSNKLFSFSILFAIWSSGKGFNSLSKGLRKIYKADDRINDNQYLNKKLNRIKSSFYTICFTVGIILFLFLIVCVNLYFYNLKLMILLGFIVFLCFIYKYISESKNAIFFQIPGALVVAFLWQMISYLFSIYFEFSNCFESMYGSLGMIIFIMIWIYMCMYIVLIGAEINANFLTKYTKRLELS